jgi:hypothetical protein
MSGQSSQTNSARYSIARDMSSSDTTFDQYSPLDDFESVQVDFERWTERVENSAQLDFPQIPGHGSEENVTNLASEYIGEIQYSSPQTYGHDPPQNSQMSPQNGSNQPNRYAPRSASHIYDPNAPYQPSEHWPYVAPQMNGMVPYTQHHQNAIQNANIDGRFLRFDQQGDNAFPQSDHQIFSQTPAQHQPLQQPEHHGFLHPEHRSPDELGYLLYHGFPRSDYLYPHDGSDLLPGLWPSSNAEMSKVQKLCQKSQGQDSGFFTSTAMDADRSAGGDPLIDLSAGLMAVAPYPANTTPITKAVATPSRPTETARVNSLSSQTHDPPEAQLQHGENVTKKRKITASPEGPTFLPDEQAEVDSGTDEPRSKRRRVDNNEGPAGDAPMAKKKVRKSEKATSDKATKPAPPSLNKHGMYFDSHKDASEKLNVLNWPARYNDPGLPKTADDRRAIVKQLYAAINDMSNFQDKVGNVLKKRWLGDGDTENAQDKFYEPWRKEKKCWEILVSLSDALNSFQD